MKILKYTLFPLKIFLTLIIFIAFVYYRSVIFHSNVTEPVDYAMSMVEDKFEITIPEYEAKPRLGRYVDKPIGSSLSSDSISTSVVAEQHTEVSTQNPTSQTLVASDTINDMNESDIVDNHAKDESEIDAQSVEPVLVDQPSLINQTDTENSINLINQLTEKLNQINLKVDQLFEQNNTPPVAEILSENDDSRQKSIDMTSSDVQQAQIVVSAESTNHMINLARQSFWNGNTDQAEKFYIDLSKYEDADPDIYGELGNVYYAQGKWKQAGEAYYEAALRLLELEHMDQAGYLLRVIQGLDQESANKLRQKMSG